VVVPGTRRDGWASGVRRSPRWAPGAPISARERSGEAHDNGLSKVIAIDIYMPHMPGLSRTTPWILIGVGAFAPNQMESGVLGGYFRSKNGSIGWVHAWAKSLGAVELHGAR
jgi:hypothetical protein